MFSVQYTINDVSTTIFGRSIHKLNMRAQAAIENEGWSGTLRTWRIHAKKGVKTLFDFGLYLHSYWLQGESSEQYRWGEGINYWHVQRDAVYGRE